MGVTVGNVLIKPDKLGNPGRNKSLSLKEMENKQDFFSGEVIEVGGADNIYPLDSRIVPGVKVLVPKIQKQRLPIDGVDHFICHYSEIKYIYDNG